MKLSRRKRIGLTRPTLLLLAGGIGLLGAGQRFAFGRPESVPTPPVPTVAAPTVVAPTPPAVIPAVPVARAPLETVTGEASYYARKFEGRRTASGIPFRNADMVAAHRRYPFGTVLRVTNTSNERSVEVTVVDRGPFGSRVRILDLSRAAAERLDFIREGHIGVKVEVLSWGDGLGD